MKRWIWAGLLCSSQAWATTGLTWRWAEGEERRYQVSTQLDLPFVVDFNAVNNTDTQVSGINLMMLVRCRLDAPIGKAAFAVRCDIDEASIQAEPLPSSVGRVGPIAEEWSKMLAGDAWIQVEMTSSGHIRSIDLEGVDKRIQRIQQIAETLRLLVVRALSPLDVGLPRKGDDGGTGQWVQPGTLINGMPRADGSVGTMPVLHQVGRVDGSRVFWSFHGDGSLASADDAASTARFSFTTKVDGSAVFDTATGAMLESQLICEGRATASSISTSSTGGVNEYRQATFIRYLAPEEQAPALAAPGELR
jgi:hypothetical protein